MQSPPSARRCSALCRCHVRCTWASAEPLAASSRRLGRARTCEKVSYSNGSNPSLPPVSLPVHCLCFLWAPRCDGATLQIGRHILSLLGPAGVACHAHERVKMSNSHINLFVSLARAGVCGDVPRDPLALRPHSPCALGPRPTTVIQYISFVTLVKMLLLQGRDSKG